MELGAEMMSPVGLIGSNAPKRDVEGKSGFIFSLKLSGREGNRCLQDRSDDRGMIQNVATSTLPHVRFRDVPLPT